MATQARTPEGRPRVGFVKTSVTLTTELHAAWQESGALLNDLIRDGLEYRRQIKMVRALKELEDAGATVNVSVTSAKPRRLRQ
jgi:hypothetical protein